MLGTVLSLAAGGQGAARPSAVARDGGVRPPRVFILGPVLLRMAREDLACGGRALLPALERLRADARKALSVAPPTVTDKPFLPPSGDKHDYTSLSIYWWPNPITRVPYIHRDGRVNPEVREFDGPKIALMARTVETLALAFYFTGEERGRTSNSERGGTGAQGQGKATGGSRRQPR